MFARKILSLLAVVTIYQTVSFVPTFAEPLQGGVKEEDYRITPDSTAKTDTLRIARAVEDDEAEPLKGLVDIGDFKAQNFDLGADRNSAEMVLAWERWHHQLTQAIYSRWRVLNHKAGRALVRITVTRDLRISAEILKSRGGSTYEDNILQAVTSLDTNPGLTFPDKSQRQVVTFDCNMTAGHVPAGYTWDKRDFETVRKDD